MRERRWWRRAHRMLAELVSLALTWSVAIPAAVAVAERQTGRDGIAEYRWFRSRSA